MYIYIYICVYIYIYIYTHALIKTENRKWFMITKVLNKSKKMA